MIEMNAGRKKKYCLHPILIMIPSDMMLLLCDTTLTLERSLSITICRIEGLNNDFQHLLKSLYQMKGVNNGTSHQGFSRGITQVVKSRGGTDGYIAVSAHYKHPNRAQGKQGKGGKVR
jgi:hypothetical protein